MSNFSSLLTYAHLVLNPVYMLISGGTALAAAAMICLFEGKKVKKKMTDKTTVFWGHAVPVIDAKKVVYRGSEKRKAKPKKQSKSLKRKQTKRK